MKNAFYEWSQALCQLFPEAGPIATMVAVQAVCGKQVEHIIRYKPVLWLHGGPATGKTTMIQQLGAICKNGERQFCYGQLDTLLQDVVEQLRTKGVMYVAIDEFGEHVLKDRVDHEQWGNIVEMVHGRHPLRFTSMLQPSVTIPARGLDATLVVGSMVEPGDLAVRTRCVLLRMQQGCSPSLYNEVVQTCADHAEEALDDLMTLQMNASGYAWSYAVDTMRSSLDLLPWEQRVVKNYAQLLALYFMMPEDWLPFHLDRLTIDLKQAMEEHFPTLRVNG